MKYPKFYFFLLFILGQWKFLKESKEKIDRINKSNLLYNNILNNKSKKKVKRKKLIKELIEDFLCNYQES